MLGVLGALGRVALPVWVTAAALSAVAVGASATAAALWVGQQGRRTVLARLTRRRGAYALQALAGGSEVDAFGLPEIEGWRGELLAALARHTPAGVRGPAAAAALARAGHFEPAALVYYAAARIAAPVLMPLLVVAATGSATPQALALGLLVGVVAPTAVLDRRAGSGARRSRSPSPTRSTCSSCASRRAWAWTRRSCASPGDGRHPPRARRGARQRDAPHLRRPAARGGAPRARDAHRRGRPARHREHHGAGRAPGTSLARVLRIHGDTLRQRRKQNAEKRAAEASVKMIIPLVLFLLPAFFAVVLGPAVVSYVTSGVGP
jgi:hypothetical protein